VALATDQPQKAIEDAEPGKPYSVGYPSTYIQGLAYLELHNAGGAIRAFQNATQYRFGSIASASGAATFYAPAQLGLARAYAMAGDKVNAKKTYEAFFATWKNADQDLMLLTAAKKEYAAL
jgi:hypothetical protein